MNAIEEKFTLDKTLDFQQIFILADMYRDVGNWKKTTALCIGVIFSIKI